jgi:hypothetical protein
MKKSLFDLGVPFLAGGVVSLLGAYGAGLITATSTARMNIAEARIDERATMCHAAAVAYLAEQTTARVAGFAGSNALAEQFVVATGDASIDRMVREACSKKLSA